MSSSDPHLLNHLPTLSSLNDELNRICDAIEAHFNSVGASINEALRAAPWLPESIKPPPQRSLPHVSAPVPPANVVSATKTWVAEHRAVSVAAVAFVGTGVYAMWRQHRKGSPRRRARRARNGAKTEVVVMAGSPHSPLTRSLARDLERKGFIVYITVHHPEEEHAIHSISAKGDVRGLKLDITSVGHLLCAGPLFAANANPIG